MPYDDDGDYYDYNNGYDDDYSDDYEDEDYEQDGGYDDDTIVISYYYDRPDTRTIRQQLQSIMWRVQYRIKQRLDYVRRWIKWHNRKCEFCGKPATADGKVCQSCDIPF